MNLRDYYGVISDYYKGRKINPKNIGTYSNIGAAKSFLKDYRGAIAEHNKALEIDPTTRIL